MKYAVRGYSDLELTPGGLGGVALLAIGIGLTIVSVWFLDALSPYPSSNPLGVPVAIGAGVCLVIGAFLFSIGRSYRHSITVVAEDGSHDDE